MKTILSIDQETGIEGLREAILKGIPEGAWINALDLLLKVRSSLREDAQKALDAATKTPFCGADNERTFEALYSLEQQELVANLNYDDLTGALDALAAENLISRKTEKEGSIPVFQLIG